MRNLVIILLASLLWSCNNDEFEIELPFGGDGTQIEIYLIKTDKIETFNPSEEINLEDLEKNPWLAHDQIEFYDWSSHTFYLKEEQASIKGGNYFVLTADDEPLFTGFFYSMLMSSFPPVPIIISDFSFGSPKDIITLNRFGFIDTAGIMTDDSDFRKEMENSGLLKEGIDVDLLALERKNSTTLKYTYKVTNMDIENIYILDSDKMGTSRFHAFTNGVYFNKGDKHFDATNFDATLSDEIKSYWYFKLAPGKSVTRSIKLNGYKSLPTGDVEASFYFPGSYNLNEREWKKSDGRIWIGNFRVEKELTIR